MFMGKVSGAHLNPAVSIAFSLRGDFPWRRVPGYVVVQLVGASLAALFLHEVIKVSAKFGSNYPATGYSGWQAYLMEAVLTLGLVSVILGTASGAQNIGIFGAIGVGSYIALAGLWGSPISGASMNPARTFGPDLVGRDFGSYWVYVAGPITGAIIAVGFAYVLRGSGGGKAGSAAAQGDIDTEAEEARQGLTGAQGRPSRCGKAMLRAHSEYRDTQDGRQTSVDVPQLAWIGARGGRAGSGRARAGHRSAGRADRPAGLPRARRPS